MNYVIGFADIAGSTPLYESVGDIGAKDLITGLQKKIAEVVADAGGQVQEIVGDEVMFRFDDIDPCATCACVIQETACRYSTEVGKPLSVRIGLHYGPALIEGGRMFGDTINTAARIAGIAQGGQIILSEPIASRLTGAHRTKVRRFDEAHVKGKQKAIVVYDLLWRSFDVTSVAPVSLYTENESPRITVSYLDKAYSLKAEKIFVIGRSPDSDLIVDVEAVSRKHVTIEFRRGRFVLSDTSTNGTYVYPEDSELIYLRRQSLPLWGRGQFSVGAPTTAGCRYIIGYHHD